MHDWLQLYKAYPRFILQASAGDHAHLQNVPKEHSSLLICRTMKHIQLHIFYFLTERFSESAEIRSPMQMQSEHSCDPTEKTTYSATRCSCYLHVTAGVNSAISASELPQPRRYSENLWLMAFFLKSPHMQGPPQIIYFFSFSKHKGTLQAGKAQEALKSTISHSFLCVCLVS